MGNIEVLENKLNYLKGMMDDMQGEIHSIEVELNNLKATQQSPVAPNGQPVMPQQAMSNRPAMQYGQSAGPQAPVQGQSAGPQAPMQGQPGPQGLVQPQPGQRPVAPQYGGPANVASPYGQPQVPNGRPTMPNGRPTATNGRPTVPNGRPVAPNAKQKSAEKITAEAMLGKNIMGIAASVLIFISFILFATLIIPKLTDGIKVVLMLGVSFGITALGLIKWFKKKESTFFLSLGACGVGAIYISLFLCNGYFHIINEYVLYILILAWAAGVLFLTKYKQRLFEIIGIVGILISVIFGCVMCMDDKDASMLVVLTIYFIIGVVTFTVFRLKDKGSLIINNIAALVGEMFILFATFDIEFGATGMKDASPRSAQTFGILIMLIAFFIGYMIMLMINANEENKHIVPIMATLHTLELYFILAFITPTVLSGNILNLIASVLIFAFAEWLYKTKYRNDFMASKVSIGIWQSLLVFVAMLTVLNMESFRDNGGMFLIMLPLVVYGFISEDFLSKIWGVVLYGILLLCVEINPLIYAFVIICGYAVINILMFIKKDQYSAGIKISSYILFLIGTICMTLSLSEEYANITETTAVLILWILGILNLVADKTVFAKNWLTGDEEKVSNVFFRIINSILMIYALVMVATVDDAALHFVAVLAAIGLFCINSYNLLKERTTLKGIYVGLKFSILLWTILGSYDAANYVISVASFIVAIIFIVIGFVMEIKSLRMYGLVLSLICVVKLVMVDITYSNTLGHALSFFISGILCFVISALYSYADKKLGSNDAPPVEMKNPANAAGPDNGMRN